MAQACRDLTAAPTTTEFRVEATPNQPRARTVVVQKKKSMSDFLAVTAQAARVIEESASDES